jgi:hypothetical protein
MRFSEDAGSRHLYIRAAIRVSAHVASVASERSSLRVQMVFPRSLRGPAEQSLRLRTRDARRIGARNGSQFDLVSVHLTHDLFEVSAPDVVGSRDVENFVSGKLRLGSHNDGVGEVVDVDVAPQIPTRSYGTSHQRSKVLRVRLFRLNPARTQRDASDVRTLHRGTHQLFTEVLGQGVGVLWMGGMIFVDGSVVRKDFSFGKVKTRHGLTRYVDESTDTEAHGRFENVERRHHVVGEHDVRWIVQRVGNRGSVHDRFGATNDGKRVARVSEIGHLV